MTAKLCRRMLEGLTLAERAYRAVFGATGAQDVVLLL